MEPRPLDLLTPREREVLELMAQGCTNAQIAERLGISFATAKTHVSDILARLGVASREDAIAVLRHGGHPRRRSGWVALPFARFAVGAGAAAVIALGAVGAASLLSIDGPPDELRVPLHELQVETPFQVHVPRAGESQHGTPYPVWLVRHEDGTVDAFIGRDPHGGCIVPYEADYEWEEGVVTVLSDGTRIPIPGFRGAFKARCTGWVFMRDGSVIFGAAAGGLDRFPARVDGDEAVVRLDVYVLGSCRPEPTGPCSPDGHEVTVSELPPVPFVAGLGP